ncbi:hypothetical protein KAU11_03060 [Candidatus Babeliales bacterium]|nr:hypothetical protein [Candidatus Babeliales bacterium]
MQHHLVDMAFQIEMEGPNGPGKHLLYASPHQKFFDPVRNAWFEAQRLDTINCLKNSRGETVKILKNNPVYLLDDDKKTRLFFNAFALNLEEPHTFYICERVETFGQWPHHCILSHNGDPVTIGTLTFAGGALASMTPSLAGAGLGGTFGAIGATLATASPLVTIVVIGTAGYAAYKLSEISCGAIKSFFSWVFEKKKKNKPVTLKIEVADPKAVETLNLKNKGLYKEQKEQNDDRGSKVYSKEEKKGKKQRDCKTCRLRRLKRQFGKKQNKDDLKIDEDFRPDRGKRERIWK